MEVQAYAYVALRQWSDFFAETDAEISRILVERAKDLKKQFNASFVIGSGKFAMLAFAIDGNGRALLSVRSSIGHCLWAVYRNDADALPESILDARYIETVARRLLARDMFLPRAGMRTLSSRSRRFDPMSYHNGSIWPHDTAMIAEGLENFGFRDEARRVRDGLIAAYLYFNTPIELFAYTKGKFREYRIPEGNGAPQTSLERRFTPLFD